MENGNKAGSLRALDALNFCNAGIQTGLGPFMSVFYTRVRHWNPGQIGTLIACQSLTGILLQSFVGSHVDQSRHKRELAAIAAITVALGAVGISLFPSFGVQIAVQLVIGLAVTVFPAVTSAFALGLVEKDQLTGRVARNESFTHTGNMIFAILAGAVGTLLVLQGIFYAAAVFAAGMAVAVYFIQQDQVNFDAARGGTSEGGEARGIRELFQDRRILWFTLPRGDLQHVQRGDAAAGRRDPIAGQVEGRPLASGGVGGGGRGGHDRGRHLRRQSGGPVGTKTPLSHRIRVPRPTKRVDCGQP